MQEHSEEGDVAVVNFVGLRESFMKEVAGVRIRPWKLAEEFEGLVESFLGEMGRKQVSREKSQRGVEFGWERRTSWRVALRTHGEINQSECMRSARRRDIYLIIGIL